MFGIILALLKDTLEAAKEFFRWRANEAQISFKTLALDTLAKIDEQTQADQTRILELRAAHRDNDADKLREQIIRRADLAGFIHAQLPVPESSPTDSNAPGNLHPAN